MEILIFHNQQFHFGAGSLTYDLYLSSVSDLAVSDLAVTGLDAVCCGWQLVNAAPVPIPVEA